MKYFDRDILIVDKYDIIVKLWKWLQKCSSKDILGIRRLKCGENVDNFEWNCDEEKWLVGFIITGAPSMPKKTASKWKTIIRPNTQNYKLNFIANNLYKIRHWDIRCADYTTIENEQATWFIDPPYVNGGQYYKYGNGQINYNDLAQWCRERIGQCIVCEKNDASWLPFNFLTSMRGNKYKSKEAVWIKE